MDNFNFDMGQFEIFLNERDRPEPAVLWLVTDPFNSGMRTGGRKDKDGNYPNRFAKKIEKCTRYNGFIGSDYGRAVQNQRNREGIAEKFEPAPLWPDKNGVSKGVHVGRYFVSHVDRPESRYLKFMPLLTLQKRGIYEPEWGPVIYESWFRWAGKTPVERLTDAEQEEAWSWVADREIGSDRQETDKPIAWNLPKMESVRMITIGGDSYGVSV